MKKIIFILSILCCCYLSLTIDLYSQEPGDTTVCEPKYDTTKSWDNLIDSTYFDIKIEQQSKQLDMLLESF